MFANEAWLDSSTTAMVHNIIWDGSDHLPMIMDLNQRTSNTSQRICPKIFRFKAKWLHEDAFRDVMGNAWNVVGSNS